MFSLACRAMHSCNARQMNVSSYKWSLLVIVGFWHQGVCPLILRYGSARGLTVLWELPCNGWRLRRIGRKVMAVTGLQGHGFAHDVTSVTEMPFCIMAHQGTFVCRAGLGVYLVFFFFSS